jgi:hypothetical protein
MNIPQPQHSSTPVLSTPGTSLAHPLLVADRAENDWQLAAECGLLLVHWAHRDLDLHADALSGNGELKRERAEEGMQQQL